MESFDTQSLEFNIDPVRKYSLARLDHIDFSTSDDFAIVVENMKKLIILKADVEELWNEEHEQNMWQFVIDPESLIFLCYTIDKMLYSSFSVPSIPVDEFFYFVKTSNDKLVSKDYDLKIMYGIAKSPYFESLYELLYKVYFPMFVENTDWSKCIKIEYLQHQSKFLSQIFDLRNELVEQLVFYVPKDILEHNDDVIVQNKAFLNEIERTVLNWIWLLMNVLMRKSHNEYGEKCGPIEEIEFWEEKYTILNKALQQLNRKDVKKCIEVMKLGKSGCLPKMIAIHQQLMNERDVASENVKFLSILKKPCDLIKTSLLTDIPKHLTILLNNVKIIWNNSSYFNSDSEISSLLSKVNNFIIDACSKHIPLDNIFSESNFEQKKKMFDVINCCSLWIQVFNASEKAHQIYALKSWSVESVAPLMNLFVHRCEELIKISDYKKLFKCDFELNHYVKGHKCFEVAEQLEAIETYFWLLLKNLAKQQNSCLDIHTTVWYDHFKSFKIEVRELELAVTKLMSNSLDSVAGINEGIQILMMFKKYFEKEVIKRDLRKCIKSLYDVFFNEINFVKKKLFESKRSSNSLLPNYGGTAFYLYQLPRKLKKQYQVLKSTSHLWADEYNINIDKQYQQVLDAINESIHTLFLQWIKTIPKDPYIWLKNSMFTKQESSHFIKINIESNTINLIEELHYWDKIDIEIPHQLLKLLEKSDVHLKRILRVLQCVKIYNRLVSSLSEKNKKIFIDTLASLEEMVLPFLIELDWSSPQPTLNSSIRVLSEHAKSVNDIFAYYEESNIRVSNICKKIGKKCLFFCNERSPLEVSDFVQMQEIYRKDILKEMHLMCLDIFSISKKLLTVYIKKKPEDEQFPAKYVEIIGKLIAHCLVESFLTSLKAIASLFGANRKNKMKIVLRISLTLRDNQLLFCPSFKELCCGIDDLIENIINDLDSVAKSEETFFENIPYENKFKETLKSSDLAKEVRQEIDFGLYKLFEAQERYKEEWKPFCHLWETDKSTLLNNYEVKGWKASCFEDDIREFKKTAEKIPYIQRYQCLDFCISDCNSLKKLAIDCSENLKRDLGSTFSTILSLNLQNAYDLLDLTSNKFLIIPKTLEELKHCLKFLIDSKAYSLKIQSTFTSIHEIFSALKKFNIPINKKSFDQERYLERNWRNLENSFTEYYIKLQKVQAMHHRYFLEFHDKLGTQAHVLQENLHLIGPFQLKYGFTNALFKILLFKKQLIDYKEKVSWMKNDSKFFKVTLHQLNILKLVENELDNLRVAWMYAKEIDEYQLQWADISLMSFNVQEKKIISDEYKRVIKELKQKVEGNHWILLKELLSKIQELEEYFTIILNFQEPTYQDRHWNSLKNILELSPLETIDFFQSNNFSFKFLQNLKIENLSEKTSMIAIQARKEFEIEQNLEKMENVWETVIFEMTDYKTSYKLKNTEDIISLVEDNQTALGVMKASKYVSYFLGKIDSLENSLCLILDVIDQTELFENKFFFLENIFAQQTVQAQLPKEFVEFQDVSSTWKDIAKVMREEQNAWKISHKDGFLQTLTEMNEKIQSVQKSLQTYLESKRRAFPRFYLISDDDLLSIIGQSSPMEIHPHLEKCFSGINLLEIIEIIEEKMRQREVIFKASGMHSKCKEYVDFLNLVDFDGPVESWMLDIEEMMISTLKGFLPKCLQILENNLAKEDFNFIEIKWLYNWPGQICLLSMQVAWTAETTVVIKAVQESAVIIPLKSLRKKWREILNQFIRKFQYESQALMKLKCMMLITSLVHTCDVIDYLIKCVCNDPNAFEWMVQLRYFYDDDHSECLIQQTKAILKYGFEYLGNRERLVITPLTERCFVSITTAFLLHQGVLIKGSKGSGKTETLQELGKSLGNYVLIINCSKGLTHLSLTHLLTGLAQIGAWGIFEEFNNVNVEILSVLSQQINVIFQSLSLEENFFSFNGQETSLDEKCGIFLSINSECSLSSYNLPSALSDIFRPVTMISPDILTIIEVYLHAYGFQGSKALSKDVHLIFKLSEEQLSVQCHYDFGLNAVICFLKCLSNMKKISSSASDADIIVASLKSTILPKLVIDDLPIFKAILDTILGSVKAVTKDISCFQKSVEDALKQNSLQTCNNSVAKVLEFHEMRKLYHAVILLGDSGSGKTTTWKTLRDVYSLLEILSEKQDSKISAVHVYTFNPKAFSLHELFGHFNVKGEWVNGLFPSVLLEACGNIRARDKWIVFDGPVDMEWIKNISSLLDRTKVLTVANGERILLPEEISLMIETTELIHCSPSVVSHCGIVYHRSDNVHWKSYFDSWLEKIENKSISKIIGHLADKYLEVLVEFPFESLRGAKVIFCSHINYITSFCKLMDSFLIEVTGEENLYEKLGRLFWFSVTWSIGSTADEKGQQLFNEFAHNLNESLPGPSSIYDYGLDQNLEWTKWSDVIPPLWKRNERISPEMVVVPTKRTVAYQLIVKKLIDEMKSVFLIGEMYCGKTCMMQNFLHSLNTESYRYTTLNVSCQTTSKKLQQTVETQMMKKAGNIYLPESGKKLIVFLDDLNLAHLDDCHSVAFLELLNMLLNCNYWYNREKWKPNHLQNVAFICAMSSQGYSQSHPAQSLLGHFNVININPPTDSELRHIFISLLKDKFSDPSLELRRLINGISLGNLDVYKNIKKVFLPTPSRMHYIFNLHNIKKIIFNLWELNPENISDRMLIAKFWFHECLREFFDKLISEEDRSIFFQNLCEIVGNQLLIQLSSFNIDTKPMFVKFLNPAKGYEEVKEFTALQKNIESVIRDYKKSHISVPIILFKNAVEHLCHIIRGIEMSYGNMFLIGVSGTGRQTLSRLAAFILKYQVFEIQLKKNYGISEFRHDLHNLLYTCGVKKQDVMFLLSEYQIVFDEFLQYITEILTAGEISNLFRQNELEKIYAEIKEEFDSYDIKKSECHKIFTENIKKHLHVVFCVNYATQLYRKCLISYPAVCKYSTSDWFEDWPRLALEHIAIKLFEDFNFGHPIKEKNATCSQVLSEIHETMMKYSKDRKGSSIKTYHFSSTFITLVTTFKKVLNEKSKKVLQAMERLESGLVKIKETQEKVNEIAIETEEARKKLVLAEKECDEALLDIQAKKAIVAEKQEAIQEKKIEIEKNEKICKKITIAAQEDLNAALPALEAARKALEALNKRDIGEIKSYAKPPVLVEIVLEAVMILRNSEPSWAEAKRQLGSPSFLKELIEYDRDNILDSALTKVKKYIQKPEFQPHIIGKVSIAAKSLCIWVHAMYMYGEIYKKVKPKKERLRIAQEELDRLQRILSSLLKELEELKAIIEQLEREHELLLKKKEEYARTAKLLALKLERANSIIQGLSSEKERWSKKILALSEKKKFVVGDSYIAAGYLAYLGPHDPYMRMKTYHIWKKKITEQNTLCSGQFDLADFFIDETVMTEWTICGLPTDQYSHEGAATVTESYCCPFIVDPEGQALKWIKNMEMKRGLKCCDLQDSKCIHILENAIVEGYPVLVQSISAQLDPNLEPLFDKTNEASVIVFNNKELKLHKNFCLYISTNLSNPHFSEALLKQICIINFTIKEKGLEDQLLTLVVRNERSDLEITKEKLVKSIRESKKQLLDIENTILKLLSESQGSLLDDEILVEALNNSKSTSIKVEENLISSEKTETVIDASREKYRPAALNAAILYFVLSDMSSVNSMYVFNLDSYVNLFLDSINKSPKDPDVARRIKKLKFYHQYAVFKYACRTVSEKHALFLTFHMYSKILKSEGRLDEYEYEFLVRGGRFSEQAPDTPNPCSQWLPQKYWELIIEIEQLPKFIGITVSFDEISKNWHEWYFTAEPEKVFLPGNWRNICNEFQKLLIIRCLRIDRITSCVRALVLNNLGKRFLEYPPLHLKEVVKESVANKPIVLFVLSTDVDLEIIMKELANNFGMADKYRAISLGQGQERVAAQLIVDAAKLGYWAFIFNCHLLLSWLPALEKIVDKLRSIRVNPEFRLFLGSSPTDSFPTTILQNAVILTFDAPRGIRANMLDLYQTIELKNDELYQNDIKYRSLLFSLSFFHSILVERKKFQNLGWNGHYFFTVADFRASVKMLQIYLNEYNDTPWDAFKNSIADTCYRNHLTDERDERLLMTYYEQYFCDEACSNIKYSLADLDTYYIPEDGPVESYVKYIKTLPLLDIAEVFEQHTNAEIPYRIQEGESILQYLAKIQGDTFMQKDSSMENQMLKVVQDIKEEVPSIINEKSVMNVLQEKPGPFSFILCQEAKRYNSLVKTVKKSLDNLEENLSGKRKMTEKAQDFLNSIQKLKVPPDWQIAYPSLKPLGSWMKDLKLRVQQFQDWSSTGNTPIKFWLPGFTSPISILNATLLTTVKKSDIMLKDLEWEYHVSTLNEDHLKEAPTEGIYVRGLFLEGAGWDKTNSLLIDPEPLHLITAMPVIHFRPVIESSMRGLYTCPCYYTSKRMDEFGRSYLFNIELKTKKPKEHWVKHGTAIIMSNSD